MDVDANDLLHLGGVSFVDTIKILSKKYNKNFDEDDFINIHKLKIKIFEENYHVHVYDDVLTNLKLLKEKGIKLCIVSGAIREVVNRVINENFKGVFEFSISDDDVDNGKPNPDPYLLAAKKFNANFEDCIIVEDSPSGIKSGNVAGIKVCGIATTLPKEELLDADLIFETHKDLFDYLLGL
jgi:HAD superfamily hydrolase (TIGR01509 family)